MYDDLTGEQNELALYALNTSELYPAFMAIIRRMQRHIAKGTYDPARAPKAWRAWVDEADRMYRREIDATKHFPPNDRQRLAEWLAEWQHQRIINNEYEASEG